MLQYFDLVGAQFTGCPHHRSQCTQPAGIACAPSVDLKGALRTKGLYLRQHGVVESQSSLLVVIMRQVCAGYNDCFSTLLEFWQRRWPSVSETLGSSVRTITGNNFHSEAKTRCRKGNSISSECSGSLVMRVRPKPSSDCKRGVQSIYRCMIDRDGTQGRGIRVMSRSQKRRRRGGYEKETGWQPDQASGRAAPQRHNRLSGPE